MIPALLNFLIEIVIIGAIFWLLWWAVSKLPVPINPPAQVILTVIFVIVLIYLLMGLLPGFAHPFPR